MTPPPDTGPPDPPSPVFIQLLEECRAMAKHALSSGLKVPPALLQQLHEQETALAARGARVELLAQAHEQLVQLVAPATPRLLVQLLDDSAAHGFTRWMGRLPLIRQMLLMAIASLLTFMAISLSSYINDAKSGNIFASEGLPLLVNEIFFLSSAALGASFAALSQIDRDLSNGSFDPNNQSSYWTRFILGLISGLILSTLANFNTEMPSKASDDLLAKMHMTSAALALLGGFSSTVVYRLLNRMVEALETMVRGSVEDMLATQQQASKARLEQQLVRERLKLVTQLSGLQRQLDSGQGAEEARKHLDTLVSKLLQGENATGSPWRPQAEPREAPTHETSREPPGETHPSEPRPADTPPAVNPGTGRLRIRYPDDWTGGQNEGT